MVFSVDLFDFDAFTMAMLDAEERGVWDVIHYFEDRGGRKLTVTRIRDTQHFKFEGLINRASLNPSEPVWLPRYDYNVGSELSINDLLRRKNIE